ncbi:GerMN domain-containing protein [Alkaliphilus pronyensis]|nr:GerMN domain-containing protein [Alkaliphilus pronyensis]
MKSKLLAVLLVLLIVIGVVACSKEETLEEQTEAPAIEETEEGTEEDTEELYYVLYLKHKDTPFIFSDSFNVKENDRRLEDKSFEHFVLEELIAQAPIEDLINPIPTGTKVLSVEKDGDTVIVNLSKEFVDNMKGDETDVEVTIAAIVNSLTTLPSNDYVEILIEGEKVTDVRGVDISQTYEFISDFHLDK